jgi:ubiquitin-protein ligase
MDKIYHLNIDPIKGTVHMALLLDDWSPYLTLTAVFDSLDLLL